MSIVLKRLDGSRCRLVWSRPGPRPHCARWGPSSLPKKGAQPQFSADGCCGQMSRWIKMPLGTMVGLRPGNIVLRSQLHPKGDSLPKFRPVSFAVIGWMDQDATWHKGRPRPRPHCVTWGPSSHSQKGHSTLQFSAHLYCGQTVAHIHYC